LKSEYNSVSERSDSETEAKSNVVQAIKQVAARLGNTPSVCRKCYVPPAVLDCYMNGTMLEAVKWPVREEDADSTEELRGMEEALLKLLKRQAELAAA
jgi:DNA topoisomerase-1